MSTSVQAVDRSVVHAYRHLYRQGLKAIQYSTPGRHMLLKSLRKAYRSSPIETFDAVRINNTIRFLKRATEVAGIEHKILKNLLMTRYWEQDYLARDFRVPRSLGLDDWSLHKVPTYYLGANPTRYTMHSLGLIASLGHEYTYIHLDPPRGEAARPKGAAVTG
ncbi:uncharacterized protein N7529_009690 [Penicillium soppii]|uniref:uncharacterized protein n=1 Tax=Penicillium soppii TaxID=69789 RepID=UPI0025485652|nr:uncharacterized protein N7529_009690 [Penicillium soppii]KAJ5855746.1 hypothetical protein N7529_009690 [Penicillium soppii]